MTIITQLLVAVALGAGLTITFHQLTQRLDVIHDLVNSNLTKVQADLKIALTRIETLEGHLSRKE